MGNNKSILIKLHDTAQQDKILTSGSTSSTSSLPVGINKYASSTSSSSSAASSPQSVSSIKTTSATSSSAGFLKRLMRSTNNDLFSSKTKKISTDKLNGEAKTKKKKYLLLPRNTNKLLTGISNKNCNFNESKNDANEPIKSSSIIKFSMNEILIEPEYTSISDCNIVNTTNSNNKESLYESAIEIYDLIKKDNATTTINKKQINLDANLYSEVLNSNNSNNNANKPNNNNNNNNSNSNNNNSETRLLLIMQTIQKYNLHNLFHRFKQAKNKNKIKQPVLPLIPAKAFNPAKEFIYEQTRLNSSKDENETNIYFKIGKPDDDDDDDEDDEIDGLKPPELPPKLDSHASDEYECMKSLLISSSSTSSSTSSSNSSSEPPPVPPLPDKPLLTQIEPINLNNQLYYSFISADGNDKHSIDNDYYSLNLANMENLISKIICLNKTEQLNVLTSQSCTNIEATESTANPNDLNSNITLNSATTNSSPKISSCASLASNAIANNNNNSSSSSNNNNANEELATLSNNSIVKL